MKFDKLLKKINQDVLVGIVIGIMLVILACFFGFCYSPKRTLLEGMDNDDSDKKSNSLSSSSSTPKNYSEHQHYVTATAAMNSACSLENNQSNCNRKSFTNNGNKYSCTWNVTNNACNLDFDKASWESWTSSKKGSLNPAKTSSSSSMTKPSSSSKSGSSSSS